MGSYVCSEKIGQFEWRVGPLVCAMERGAWLVLKNLQEANEEVLHGLIAAASRGAAELQSQGRTIRAHFAFKLIGIGIFTSESTRPGECCFKTQLIFSFLSSPSRLIRWTALSLPDFAGAILWPVCP